MKPTHRAFWAVAPVALAAGCVPPGNSQKSDAGSSGTVSKALLSPSFRPSIDVMTAPFEDDFDRPPPRSHVALLPSPSAGASARAPKLLLPPPLAAGSASAASAAELAFEEMEQIGPNWRQAATRAWHIENGRLCGARAFNHGIWLNRVLPINARIEFDAIAESPQGDLKAEVWGDGQSHATAISYTNATSYLAILGGWKNTYHVLARENEHGRDRKQVTVDAQSDDPRAKPVYPGQVYHFKIERTDGHTVRWSVNGLDYLSYDDPRPLIGMGHDHFGFNDWEVKVCFDNVKITPLL